MNATRKRKDQTMLTFSIISLLSSLASYAVILWVSRDEDGNDE